MSKVKYKVVDLFGKEQVKFTEKKKNRDKTLFTDYDGFVDKFEHKKTTDDCYTPKDVMDIIIEYVNEKHPLKNMEIIRPFFPGGDFESIEYPANAAVIDNPPFSIITKICKYYIERGIKFFLFCPHMTAFSPDIEATHVIASASITYENGAKIKTSFVTNMFGDVKIIGDAGLYAKFKELENKNKTDLPKYKYPDNILTVSKISYCVEKGVSVSFDKKDLMHYRQMDSQKAHKKSLFGSGFIASNRAAAEIAAATRAAEIAATESKNAIFWELSPKEIDIIKTLGEP